MHVAESRSILCNKDVGPITLQPLYDVIVALVMDYSLIHGLDHDTICNINDLIVK